MLYHGFVFLVLWTFIATHYSISNINCIDVKSSLMNTTNGIATAACSSPYTLVSCGFEMASPTSLCCCGSYISGSTCYARNRGSTTGVYAVAHCCDLTTYSISCNTYQSPLSSGVDDSHITASCQSNEVLMGCTAMTPGSYIDGSFPGNTRYTSPTTINPLPNVCTGWDAATTVYSYATCCKAQDFNKITFECIALFSDYAPASPGSTVSLTCPLDYFMTSCTAGGAWKNMNQWSISSGTCIGRNQRTTTTTTGNVAAICCKVVTLSPTTHPTTTPSRNPTGTPTTNPTVNPTTNPTNIPTVQPTTNPTYNPTILPTMDPSLDPTIEPTFYPTKSPTKVTLIPTTNPTVDPTTDPSNDPTSDPTKDPTLPEGVIDSKDISTTELSSNEQKSAENDIQKGTILGVSSWIIYMIIGSLILMVTVCILAVFMKKRIQKRKTNVVSIVHRIDSDTEANEIGTAVDFQSSYGEQTHAQIAMPIWNSMTTVDGAINQGMIHVTTGGNIDNETPQGMTENVENNQNIESVNNDNNQESGTEASDHENDDLWKADVVTTGE